MNFILWGHTLHPWCCPLLTRLVFCAGDQTVIMLFILVTLFSLAFCTTPEGLKFLEEYSKRDGVITLPSGLRYRVLKSGDGNAHPKVGTSGLFSFFSFLILKQLHVLAITKELSLTELNSIQVTNEANQLPSLLIKSSRYFLIDFFLFLRPFSISFPFSLSFFFLFLCASLFCLFQLLSFLFFHFFYSFIFLILFRDGLKLCN